MGVGSVALLHATVRRTSGAGAALIAGAALALTPVAALMFRFNNPDALLVLLLVAAAYFLKLAFDNGWIGPSGRVAIGLLAGITLVFFANRILLSHTRSARWDF